MCSVIFIIKIAIASYLFALKRPYCPCACMLCSAFVPTKNLCWILCDLRLERLSFLMVQCFTASELLPLTRNAVVSEIVENSLKVKVNAGSASLL